MYSDIFNLTPINAVVNNKTHILKERRMTTSRAKKYDPAFMARVGSNLKERREAAGYTQQEVTDRFGYKTNASVVGWEKGKWLPSLETLSHLADLYGCTLNELLSP